MPETLITQKLTLWEWVPDGLPRDSYDAELTYSAADPYAVCLEHEHPLGGEPAAWVFARDLLIEGLRKPLGSGRRPLIDALSRPAGRGDVQLGATHTAEWLSVILATDPDAPLTLFTARAPVTDFAERTLALVPVGADEAMAWRDLDAWLAQAAR